MAFYRAFIAFDYISNYVPLFPIGCGKHLSRPYATTASCGAGARARTTLLDSGSVVLFLL